MKRGIVLFIFIFSVSLGTTFCSLAFGEDEGTFWAGQHVPPNDTFLGAPARPWIRPFERPSIVCTGLAGFDGENVKCSGISAKVFNRRDGAPFNTQIVGRYGANVSIEGIDFSNVRLEIGYKEGLGFFVRRIVQGPVLSIRGIVQKVDSDQGYLVINGLRVSFNERTRRNHFCNVDDLGDSPLACYKGKIAVSLVQYVDGGYYALKIRFMPIHRPHHHPVPPYGRPRRF